MSKLNERNFTGNTLRYSVDDSDYVVEIIEIKGASYEAWLYSKWECVKQLLLAEDVYDNYVYDNYFSLDDFIKKVEEILPEAIISYDDKYVR